MAVNVMWSTTAFYILWKRQQREEEEHEKIWHAKIPIPSTIVVPSTTMAPKTPKSGRKSGCTNFSSAELLSMLCSLETVLPMGTEEWKLVTDDHREKWPPGRNTISIRRKYMGLHRMTIPTGDPNVPPEVRQAKRIKYKIGARAEILTGVEEYNPYTNCHEDEDAEGDVTEVTQDTTLDDIIDESDAVVDAVVGHTGVSITGVSKRSYTNRTSDSDMLQFMEDAKTERAEAKEQAKKNRAEDNERADKDRAAAAVDRKALLDTASAFVAWVKSTTQPAAAAPTKKRKIGLRSIEINRHDNIDSDSTTDS